MAITFTREADQNAPLTGSEKQIKWASSIRAEKISEMMLYRSEMGILAEKQIAAGSSTREQVTEWFARFDAATLKARQITSAAWWIDRRNFKAGDLLQAIETGK